MSDDVTMKETVTSEMGQWLFSLAVKQACFILFKVLMHRYNPCPECKRILFHYYKTHKTVNTKYIYGMILCCEEKANKALEN